MIFAMPVASTGMFSILKYISIQVAYGPKDNCPLCCLTVFPDSCLEGCISILTFVKYSR